MYAATCKMKWLNYLLTDLQAKTSLPVTLHYDNEAAVAITKNPVIHERTKHIEIDCHIMRNMIFEGFLNIQSISTKRQLVDLFTKALSSHQMEHVLLQLNVIPSCP